MKKFDICITGASSFSGAWFSKKLLQSGYSVLAIVNSERTEIIEKRIGMLESHEKFQAHSINELLKKEYSFEILALHGTATFDYRSSNFDTEKALRETVQTTTDVLNLHNPKKIIHTGTFSEKNESVSDLRKESFNSYSESKSMIWDKHKEIARQKKIEIYKYVMPNPYGPLENPKFTSYLVKCWSEGSVPKVKFPNYIRDNVPIDLLSNHYAKFVENILDNQYDNEHKIYPSFYVESVLAFAQRYSREIGKRLKTNFSIDFEQFHEFQEPRIRVNSDLCTDLVKNWNEVNSWDFVAEEVKPRLELKS